MESSEKQVVTVRVFGSKAPIKSCCCGSSCCESEDSESKAPSHEELAEELEAKPNQYYGSSVQFKYIDIFSKAMASYDNEFRMILSCNLPLPVVNVNDEPVFAGGLPLGEITEKLEVLGITPIKDATPGNQ